MRDPLQAEPSPYETLGVTSEATDAEILVAFGDKLKDGKDTHREMRAKRMLQDPVERTLVDMLEYRQADLEGLSPSPLEDPSALDPEHRAATARAWEEQLIRRFPDLGIAHSLAVLWLWWTEHEANQGEDGPRAHDPSLPEMWERSIAYWAMLVNAEAFWQARCRGDGDVARRARQRLVEDLRNRLDRARREHEARHDDVVADALQRLEVILDTEIDMGGRIASGGIRTPNGRVTCGPLLLRHLRLLDSVSQQVDRALEANPSNADLRALRDALSPLSHLAMLIQQEQPQRALDALAALPAGERDTPEARAMRARAQRLLGEQVASVGEFERALLVWQEALDNAQTAGEAAALRSQVASTCLHRVASMPEAQRDAAIALLDKTHQVVDDEHIRARLAELLASRGIDTINRAQEKRDEWTMRSVKAAIRKGVGDLDRAAKLGSERARQQAVTGHALLQQAESGMIGIPSDLAGMLSEASSAAEREDWDTAVNALSRALDRAGPKPPDGLRSNLAVCLANRANGKTNRAIGMLQQKGRTIDDGLRQLIPRRAKIARKLQRPVTFVGFVLRNLLGLVTGAAVVLWALTWILGQWWPAAIGSWFFPAGLYDWLNTPLNVQLLAGALVIGWIVVWVLGRKPAKKRRSFLDSACAACGSTAHYEVRASEGRVSLCADHAHKLEAWTQYRPFVPAAVELLASAHEDMKRAAKVAPAPAEYARNAREIEKVLEQAVAGNPRMR